MVIDLNDMYRMMMMMMTMMMIMMIMMIKMMMMMMIKLPVCLSLYRPRSPATSSKTINTDMAPKIGPKEMEEEGVVQGPGRTSSEPRIFANFIPQLLELIYLNVK